MKLFTKILTLILAALGFTACERPVMYAPPPSAFVRIDVTVLDKTDDKPVCCARVVVKYLNDAEHHNNTLRASIDGKVDVYDYPKYPADLTYRLIVEDVEHEVYKTDSIDVTFRTTDFDDGNGEINRGSAKKDVVIKLEKKIE